jgi:phage terminase large subunit-like protein
LTDRTPPAWAIRTKADERALAEGCYWDAAQADAIIRFTERVYRSQFIKGPIRLREEQRQFLQSIYGWRLSDGRRRFRFVTLHVPKKSYGKSLMLTVVALFELLVGGEPSPVILAGAATRENAGALYTETKYALEKAGLGEYIRFRDASKKLHVPHLNATLECVSKWGKSTHGPNCSLVLLDECHVMEQSLYQALRYAGRTRPNFMCLLASTAGDDTTHWYYALYQKAKRIVSGEDLDITHFAFVCEADPEGDYAKDETQWFKANPNLGSPECPLDTFRAELQAAKSTGTAEWLNFLKLNLNVWVKPSEFAWLDVTAWDRFKADVPDEELVNYRCGLGVDGSQTTDPTSVSLVWELPDGKLYTKSWAFVCRAGVEQREASNLRKYDEFPEVQITDGSMIDYPQVRNFVVELCQKYKPVRAAFDPTMAAVLMSEVGEDGWEVRRVPQTFRYFDPPMRRFQLAWDQEQVLHDGSSWLRFCFTNVRCELNKYGELRPHRGRSPDKIDGAVSTLLALWGLLDEPKPSSSLGGF